MNFFRSILLCFLFLFSTIIFAANPSALSCSKSDSKAIEKAINNYIDSNEGSKVTVFKSNDLVIRQMKCVQDYAVALLHPKKPVTDDANIWLRKTNKKWEVLGLGTGEMELEYLPENIRKIMNGI